MRRSGRVRGRCRVGRRRRMRCGLRRSGVARSGRGSGCFGRGCTCVTALCAAVCFFRGGVRLLFRLRLRHTGGGCGTSRTGYRCFRLLFRAAGRSAGWNLVGGVCVCDVQSERHRRNEKQRKGCDQLFCVLLHLLSDAPFLWNFPQEAAKCLKHTILHPRTQPLNREISVCFSFWADLPCVRPAGWLPPAPALRRSTGHRAAGPVCGTLPAPPPRG